MTIIGKSFNGWPVSRDPREIDLVTITPVPGRSFRVVRVAGPLFAYLIRRFHEEVEPITGGVLDDWSYNVRPARTQDASAPPRSNHGSGTAVDLNATHFPRGRTNMTAAQYAAVRKILASCLGVVAWGGDFSRSVNKDQMHFELALGTTKASVERVVKILGLDADGVQQEPAIPKPAPKPAPKPPVQRPAPVPHPVQRVLHLALLKPGTARSADVKAYQTALRALAGKLGVNVKKINPSGATGLYRSETVALTRAVYLALGKRLGPAWVRGDLSIPGPSLIKQLGFTPK